MHSTSNKLEINVLKCYYIYYGKQNIPMPIINFIYKIVKCNKILRRF